MNKCKISYIDAKITCNRYKKNLTNRKNKFKILEILINKLYKTQNADFKKKLKKMKKFYKKIKV